MLDLRLDVGETDATVTDSIEDTVDYGEVCQLVALVAQQRSHKTLERLCSTIADRLLDDYELEGVWVKAAKPEPPIALTVEEVSVEVWREAERLSDEHRRRASAPQSSAQDIEAARELLAPDIVFHSPVDLPSVRRARRR